MNITTEQLATIRVALVSASETEKSEVQKQLFQQLLSDLYDQEQAS